MSNPSSGIHGSKPSELAARPMSIEPDYKPPPGSGSSAPHKKQMPALAPSQRPDPAHKYPQIAIKPRPIAVAPKPVATGQPPPFKSSFDLTTRAPFTPDAPVSLNINTSKKWVLPPRPRPGRKPIAQPHAPTSSAASSPAASAPAMSPSVSVTSPTGGKDKPKLKVSPKRKAKKCEVKPPQRAVSMHPLASSPGPAQLHAEPIKQSLSQDSLPNNALDAASRLPSLASLKAKEEMVSLQKVYLARLKEQELIRNYIDVINNQIKELRFVQSGVITFDALNGETKSSATPPTLASPKYSPHEQLEQINNMNDLNKFLAYLTKSTSVIHSVTKKFMGDSQDQNIANQIAHYLEIRSKYKLLKTQELKSLEKIKREKMKHLSKGSVGLKSSKAPPSSGAASSILLSPVNSLNSTPAPSSSHNEVFTPSLLHTLPLDLFNPGDDFDFADTSALVPDDSMEQLNLHSLVHEDVDLDFDDSDIFKHIDTKVSPQLPSPVSKSPVAEPPDKEKKKFNCGFCTSGTPCLCLDAEAFSL